MARIGVIGALVELVLPRSCVACGAPGAVLCRTCGPGAPFRIQGAGLPTHAAARYEAGVRAAILAYKERGRRDLTEPLAALLAQAVGAALAGASAGAAVIALVPVGSAAAAARQRGGDHVLRLARLVARNTGMPVARALRLQRGVRDSAGLHTGERAANLAGAMSARAAPPGFAALVLDDIVTTGATIAEADRALRAAGWPVLGAAVIAATPAPNEQRRMS